MICEAQYSIFHGHEFKGRVKINGFDMLVHYPNAVLSFVMVTPSVVDSLYISITDFVGS
jgi:hypothetical protein